VREAVAMPTPQVITGPDTPLAYALVYAKRGWPVFPLHTPKPNGKCSCRRSDCESSAGKHPRIRNWQRDASMDPKRIHK
jgi:hypothetical protein